MPQLLPGCPGQRKKSRWAYLRSLLPVVAILLAFSFLLASYSLLSHFKSPAIKQHLGWQSWDIVQVERQNQDVMEVSNSTGDFNPSIPIDIWDPLAIHTTGLTEIAVKPCYFPPNVLPSYCAPKSTPDEDKTKGKWVLVPRDLNAKSGLWFLHVYYRRTRRLDTPLISDIQVVPDPVPDALQNDLIGWTKASGDLHSGVWPTQKGAGIWYKLQEQTWAGRTRQAMTLDFSEIVTEIDIVYGDDDPFFGFTRVKGGKVLDAKPGKWDSVDLAYRRGNSVADLHYSVGTGTCRDTDKQPCVGDPDTATWLSDALDEERPDLVVFSGDQLNGQGTSYDARSVLAKFAKPVIDRKIPWAAVFGNHDSEIAGDREEQVKALQAMPYSLVRAGPKGVDGHGNCEYLITLRSNDASRIHLLTLYFIDSHDYEGRTLPWVKPDYGFIQPSQIEWYTNTSSHIQPIERPFRPDGASDLGHVWAKRARPIRLPRQDDKRLAKPNAMMWFHIPLPEAYDPADRNSEDGTELSLGEQLDGAGNSKHNSGMLHDGIKAALETIDDGQTSTRTTEVKVLSHGHCHNTDRCRRVQGVWMCFDGGSSFSGYGDKGFDRRVRVYQISEYGEKIETYKRLSSGDIIDQQILVGSGSIPGTGQGQTEF